MLWERAKNLTILFFAVINVLLAVFLYAESGRYTLSQEQERAIYQVLAQNKVSLSYFKMIRQFSPMKYLTVSGYHYDTDALLSLLFDDPASVTGREERGRTVYEDGTARLVISNGYISYDNPTGYGRVTSREAAINLCGEFIKQNYPNFQLDGTFVLEDGLRLCYREMYQEYVVYANFIEFLVTDNGIVQIDMQYGAVKGFSGSMHEICAPDEALLTFLQRIRQLYGDTPLLIKKMDIVYNQDEFSVQENVTLPVAPYYRIFIENQDIPFMVNAITNTMS